MAKANRGVGPPLDEPWSELVGGRVCARGVPVWPPIMIVGVAVAVGVGVGVALGVAVAPLKDMNGVWLGSMTRVSSVQALVAPALLPSPL